tara:strand:+ start:1440 stop:2147 length:708 start_codon:yes stop_codon:yes gene_type:complete
MKEIKIDIPIEFTIEHYSKLGQYEHLSEVEKIIRIVAAISNYDEDFIRTWDISSLQKVYLDIHNKITNTEAIFLPIFEFEGVKYGLQPISKMIAGEYIDLEKQLQDSSVLDVISIIYRPIVKDRFNSLEWKVKNDIKFIQGKAENLFKYYSVEDYDSEKREWRKDIFKNLPMSIALGAYNFFLLIGIQLSNNFLQSSQQLNQTDKKMWKKGMDQVFKNILDGSTHSTISQKMEEY